MLNHIIIFLLCVLITCTIAYGGYEHFTDTDTTDTTTSPSPPFYSPIMLEKVANGQCKPVPISEDSCQSYNASVEKTDIDTSSISMHNENTTVFTKPVKIDKLYLCKTGNCVFSQLNKPAENYNEIFSSMNTKFKNGFDDLVTAKILNSAASEQPPEAKDTLQGKIATLKATQIELYDAHKTYQNAKHSLQQEGSSIWRTYCMNTPYDDATPAERLNIFSSTADQSISTLSANSQICTQMHSLFTPNSDDDPLVVRAQRAISASGGQYGFIEVIPYTNLVTDNIVWTGLPICRFVSNPENSEFVHPKGQFVPQQTYYIRSAVQDGATSELDDQIILWVNKPVTVFVELWMPAEPKIGATKWCANWTKMNQPLARFNSSRRSAEVLLNLSQGPWFTQGVFARHFPPGKITLKGSGGTGSNTAPYYVFVTSATIDLDHIVDMDGPGI